MKFVKRTDDYTVFQRRDGRYAVVDAKGNAINGDAKVQILIAEDLVKVVVPAAPVAEEVVADAPEAAAEEAAAEAKDIIEAGVREHLKQQRALNAVATLRAFRESADTIRESELQRALKSLEKGEAPEAVLNALARGLTNKLIHSPSVQMKKASAEGRDEFLLLIRELYELESDAD